MAARRFDTPAGDRGGSAPDGIGPPGFRGLRNRRKETVMADIHGSNQPDTLFGTMRDDRIDGRGGDDVLTGLGGSDRILGGAGNDTIHDDAVDVFRDPFYPGGDDLVFGGPGDDFIRLSFGNDTADGGAGNDTIRDDLDTDDILVGGAGNDLLIDFSGADLYLGGSGDDRIVDGHLIITGPDDGADRYLFERVRGGFGNDTILGFDQGYGDRIEFQGYRPSDLLALTETERATVFSFRDGSQLTVYQDEQQILHGMTLGQDYFFV